MSLEFIEGKRHAAEILSVFLSSPTYLDIGSGLSNTLENLEQSAEKQPFEYRRGVMAVVSEVRRAAK